ncbi:MAG TPA: hypothetical protein DDW49_03940 [Deltaproteobacteria bacterium]|nr:MAG: hypothetical protein A2048_04980 [Deltaproteobacteria bacterium GWA2_45_12]HBF12530.1 hypothetical protein [Deltaproteobacteria bacterium]
MKSFFNTFLLVIIFSSVGCSDFRDIFESNIETPHTYEKTRKEERQTAKEEKKRDKDLKKERKAEIAKGRKKQSITSRPVKPRERFVWPVDGKLSSGFGPRRGRDHDGIDILAPKGTPIGASRSGKVIYIGRMHGYGNLVILKHENNFFSAYAHLNEIKTKQANEVKQGQVIGTVGHTGRASAYHLHFEIREKTVPKDPLLFLPKKM